jgi:SHS2 domain-containing protein
MKRYEQFPHTADIGVRVYGKDLKELFANAAFAMFDIIADLEGMKVSAAKDIELKAANYEELLVAWLDELLYNFYTKWVIFSDFRIEELDEHHIKAKALGRSVGENKNRLKAEIKAATYHDLNIKKTADGYEVEIIFDI